MDEKQDSEQAEQPIVRNRTMEIVVAALLMLLGVVVAFDSYRLGARWAGDGPQSGYFPFYIGLIICVSNGVTLAQAVFTGRAHPSPVFVKRGQLKSVLSVLIPAAFYVLAIQLIGIYVASAIYIASFMIWLGGYGWLSSVVVGISTSASIFAMFEIWFKVPLPKGMFDMLSFLGY